jgi:hypothetical protein
MMAFFFNQMVSSSQLQHADRFKVGLPDPHSTDHELHPWLTVCDLIPDHKKKSKGKTQTTDNEQRISKFRRQFNHPSKWKNPRSKDKR